LSGPSIKVQPKRPAWLPLDPYKFLDPGNFKGDVWALGTAWVPVLRHCEWLARDAANAKAWRHKARLYPELGGAALAHWNSPERLRPPDLGTVDDFLELPPVTAVTAEEVARPMVLDWSSRREVRLLALNLDNPDAVLKERFGEILEGFRETYPDPTPPSPWHPGGKSIAFDRENIFEVWWSSRILEVAQLNWWAAWLGSPLSPETAASWLWPDLATAVDKLKEARKRLKKAVGSWRALRARLISRAKPVSRRTELTAEEHRSVLGRLGVLYSGPVAEYRTVLAAEADREARSAPEALLSPEELQSIRDKAQRIVEAQRRGGDVPTP
jgi:hypothetical protein